MRIALSFSALARLFFRMKKNKKMPNPTSPATRGIVTPMAIFAPAESPPVLLLLSCPPFPRPEVLSELELLWLLLRLGADVDRVLEPAEVDVVVSLWPLGLPWIIISRRPQAIELKLDDVKDCIVKTLVEVMQDDSRYTPVMTWPMLPGV